MLASETGQDEMDDEDDEAENELESGQIRPEQSER